MSKSIRAAARALVPLATLLLGSLLATTAVAQALPTLSIADASVVEGNSEGVSANLVFVVTLSQPSATPVTFDIATSDGTATAASDDYFGFSLTGRQFAPGETSLSFTVKARGDVVPEPDETFNITVSNVQNATVAGGQAVGTILTDDASGPMLSIADVSVSEGDSGTKVANFVVSLSTASASPVSFDVASANGTATAGSDYVALALSGQTIAAGQTSKTIPVTINGDGTIEGDETFSLSVANVSGANILDGSATGTIVNDDDLPTLSINDVSVSEGNSGTKTATFNVQLSAPAPGTVTFDIQTSDGDALAPTDYVAMSLLGQTMAAGQTSKSFTVTINGDTTFESDETFSVRVTNVDGANTGDSVAIGTIVNDDGDPVPNMSIGDISITEGNSGTKTATFTVSLSKAAAGPVLFDIATEDGTALAGSDYVAKSLTGVRMAAGVTSKSFTVTINGDTAFEPDEYFGVHLGNVSGARVTDGVAVGTILDDDAANTPMLSIADVSVSEGNSGTKTAVFAISLSIASASTVSFNVDTSDATATAGSDYVAKHQALTIPAGQTSASFAVTINGDTAIESDEVFQAQLGNVSGAAVSDGIALGTITNDDGGNVTPSISINDVTVAEGNAGTKEVNFTISLSQPTSSTVTFDLFAQDGSAQAGSDYFGGSVAGGSIPAGQASVTQSVTIYGDTLVEADENFTISIQNVTGATVADGVGTGTITNDDSASGPTLSIGDVSVVEGNSGTKSANFTVTLSAAQSNAVTFDAMTMSGTADAGYDFVGKVTSGIRIPPGVTSKVVAVTINGDTNFEPDENFKLLISNSVGATIVDGEGLGTIVNDDASPTPTLSIADASISEGNGGTKTLTFTVNLSPAASSAIVYDIATSDGTATSGSDYVASSLTGQLITAGATSKTFAVTINGDTAVEANETFNVTLSNANGAVIGDGVAVGTITNDDSAGGGTTLSIGDVTIAEGNSLSKQATFTVSLSAPASTAVTYNIATADGTAIAPTDYTAKSLTGQSIPAGSTSKTFTVAIKGDRTVEPNETFLVNVTNVAGASLGDGQATGTISNDDSATLSVSRFDARGLVDDVDDGNREPRLATSEYALLLADSARAMCRNAPKASIIAVEGVEHINVLADLGEAANGLCPTMPRYSAVMSEGDTRGFLVEAGTRVLGRPERLAQANATALRVQVPGEAEATQLILAGAPRARSEQASALARHLAEASADGIVLLGAANDLPGFTDLTLRAQGNAGGKAPGVLDHILVDSKLLGAYEAMRVQFPALPNSD